MAGGGSTKAERLERDTNAAEAQRAREAGGESPSAAELAKDIIFTKVMEEVRAEIQFVFGGMEKSPVELSARDQALQEEADRGWASSIEKFLRDGTTLISRNPVDMEGAARGREYVLANRLISAKGTDAKTKATEGIEKGNKDEGQDPLDMYMEGFKLLLSKLYRMIPVEKMKEFEVKVVGTDGSNVDEETRNHFIVHEGLESFIPPKASSRGTK